MKATIAAWKNVIAGLKAGDYGFGSDVQDMLDQWRILARQDRATIKRLTVTNSINAMIVAAKAHDVALQRIQWWRHERHEWLLKQERYGDGTPIPDVLPF